MLKSSLLIALFSLNSYATLHTLFESSEHVMAGDDISIKGLLHLPNGLGLSFGDIVAMGDFYGVPGSPISQGATEDERKVRFMAAFDTLASAADSVPETIRLIEAIHVEKKSVVEEFAKGQATDTFYQHSSEERVKLWNCITGGACSGIVWFLAPGRYLLLANTDYDHFGDNAMIAYQTGHQVALQQAAQAGKNNDAKGLELAYAMDAFASHFLTDRFSSGHMRTPRVELPTHITPSLVGSLLAIFMHNEECAHGLHVHNEQGDKWVAYGDGYYLDPRNHENLLMMKKTLQLSVDEIHEAFSTGRMPTSSSLLSFIPQTDESGSNGGIDIAPMFYWNNTTQKLMRRSTLSNPNDHHWTSHWLGWSTLAELKAFL